MAFGNLMLILSFILSIELIGVMCASPILEVPCNELGASQMICDFDCNCRYGVSSIVSCVASNYTNCTGDRTFNRTFTCEFCWQTNAENYACASNTTCYSARNDWYVSNCSIIDDNYLCIGPRWFQRNLKCNFVGNTKWSTSFILSIFLGGFGIDRMYMGYVGWGVFKLLTLGGVGVWTLIDVVLIGIGYLTPGDGSLFVDLK